MSRLLKKIHLWLSVPFGIFIILICFSGATMVFEKEITEWWQSDLYKVAEVKEQPLPLDSLMRIAEAALPDSIEITSVTVSSNPERPYQITLSRPRRASMFIDQYTGEVKGRYQRLPFFDTMFHLHRWLLCNAQSANGGMSIGKLIVGITVIALVIILITGILMWLTNKHRPLRKSLTISFTKGWMRFWHDLHVAGGIYATIFLLAIGLTGLTWSFSWYRSGFYSLFGVEASASNGHGGYGERQGHSSEVHRGRGAENHGGGDLGRRGHRSPYRHWQYLLETVADENPGYRQITLKKGSVEVVPAGRNSLRATDKYSYDRRSGEITEVKLYSDEDRAAKLPSAIYMVHVGSWGGWLTRIINFLAAILGVSLPLTGYYLWIKRLCRKKQAPK
ncbi:MAG: PepSY-associated TM helix domain-containing protein [Muribaculaceae bacterium]